MSHYSIAPLTKRDHVRFRALMRADIPANLFPLADLEHFGWNHPDLRFYGLFKSGTLAGHLMCYGASGCCVYDDVAFVPLILEWLKTSGVTYVNGLTRHLGPVLAALPANSVVRYEPSTLMVLSAGHFNQHTLSASPGQAWKATMSDLEGATQAHLAAPDEFGHLDYHSRRNALRTAIVDGWRRVYVAGTPKGQIVAVSQTSAEAKDFAIIGGVVTAPQFRGLGYSTACTGALAAALLAEGKQPFLFYRTDNIAAARVYTKIGFQAIDSWTLAEIRP